MKMYGLKSNITGKLARVSASSNDGSDFCGSIAYSLESAAYDYEGDPVWLVSDRNTAEEAAVYNAPWYNAGYDSPSNESVGMWTVVEVNLEY